MKTTIIAEAGVNHNGDIGMALRLVDAAADAGADYIKFQTFNAAKLVAKSARLADYQRANVGEDSQLAMLKKLELSAEDHRRLIHRAEERGIKFMSTAFDLDSIAFLAGLHLDFWKVPSGEITNFPYLREIGRQKGRVVLSTGMCALGEIEEAIYVLTRFGTDKRDIIVLHCNTEYPTPMRDVNLRAMDELRRTFGAEIGYSDHTRGIEVPIAAVALGATVIEKHFTLDRNLPGPDHKASLEPSELKAMVSAIRNVEQALGREHKCVSDSERKNREVARKSIVAACRIRKGEILSDENLAAKRPGDGISPMRWESVAGTQAIRDFEEDEQIEI